ncbi:hypothetical protein [Streptomyces sp. NBC_01264]|uniref:hypothetical protein n=1 Tax=Streptomyces sp. NBC_01264 TaxID=2903804 RepID=UPI00224CBFB5|nr:hypothetical protein [Streptomyces sp. NBC_01264]MCX4781648.1 hypothetical protein [Streptomyces sp. NBC_01264]
MSSTGALVTTWDWTGHGTSLWSGKPYDPGCNLQIAAVLAGDLIAASAPLG